MTGLLPPGRHVCAPAELEVAFVSSPAYTASITRADIWNDWQAALALLQGAALVHAAWIGGSFTTSKVDPGDIDVTFLINADDYRLRSPADQQVTDVFVTGQVKAVLGLRVDSYAIGWECLPTPLLFGQDVVQDVYFRGRGYWDDWWQRSPASRTAPPVPADAVPRRGYLEVLISDYP